MTPLNPDAPQSTAPENQARLQREVLRITIFCKEKNSTTTAENVRGPSFTCPLCEETLVYLPKEHRLGAHGRSTASMQHELRKVQTVGTIGTV